MNSNNDHITHYSAADIQRYVQGRLSAKEMHAMEKAALDDPFLADAIEGMQQALHDHDESVVTGQLQELQQQFQTRIAHKGKKARVIAFHWWQAAAAAVVLIITGVWLYTGIINSPSSNTSIAKTEKAEQKTVATPQPSAEALHDDTQLSVTSDSVAAPAEINANAVTDQAGIQHKNLKAKAAKTIPAQAAPPVGSYYYPKKADTVFSDIANRRSIKKEVKEENLAYKDMAAAKSASPLAAARAKKAEHDFGNRETELITIDRPDTVTRFTTAIDKKLSGFVKGRVTDHRNNPIAYANLQVYNNNHFYNQNNFMTDKSGFFKIPVKDSVVDVAVNVAGYGTQNFRLQNNAAMNQLQLQPAQMALNEVEVTPLSERKAKAIRAAAAARNKLSNAMDQNAEPTFGWVTYEQYLQKNKRVPAGFENKNGNVVVSFEVNKKGELSDFRVEQSPALPFNKEAIRLIKEGPSWTLLKGRKARVTVIVRF